MAETTVQRTRRPRPRHRDVIIGAINERIQMIVGTENAATQNRLQNLMEELARALNGSKGEESSE